MIDPLVPQDDHVMAWIDRVYCMEFIGDQHEHDRMKPAYFWAACRDSDINRTEAALWWS